MLRFGIQSLAKLALLVIGALIVVDWLSKEEKSSEKTDDDKGKEEDAEAKPDDGKEEDAEAKLDDGKDVEGDAVIED